MSDVDLGQSDAVNSTGDAQPTKRGSLFAKQLEGDWPVQATDTVERLVNQVRSKSTGKAIVVSRVVVYGLVIAVLGSIALILGLVAMVRVVDLAMPTYAAHLVIGAGLVFAGLLLWRKRAPRSS